MLVRPELTRLAPGRFVAEFLTIFIAEINPMRYPQQKRAARSPKLQFSNPYRRSCMNYYAAATKWCKERVRNRFFKHRVFGSVSGLQIMHCSPEILVNSRVLLVTRIKPLRAAIDANCKSSGPNGDPANSATLLLRFCYLFTQRILQRRKPATPQTPRVLLPSCAFAGLVGYEGSRLCQRQSCR